MSKAKRARDLYVMINELDMVKIGISSNVERRVREVANASGLEVRLIAKASLGKATGYGAEQYIFARFERYRAVGEWFVMDLLADYDIEDIIPFKPEVYSYKSAITALSNHRSTLADEFEFLSRHERLPPCLETIAEEASKRCSRRPTSFGQYTSMVYFKAASDCIELIMKHGWAIKGDALGKRRSLMSMVSGTNAWKEYKLGESDALKKAIAELDERRESRSS